MLEILKRVINFISKHLTLVLVLIIFFLLFLLNCAGNREPKVIKVAKDNSDLIKEMTFYKTQSGAYAAKIKQLELSKTEILARNEELAKELKVKPKQIKGTTVYLLRIDTIKTDVPYYIDTSKGTFKFLHKDAWATVSGSNMNPEKKLNLEMSFKDTVRTVEIIKKRLFSKDVSEVIFLTASPYTQAISGYSYKPKQRTLVATLGPGVMYDVINRTFTMGISLSFPIFKFYN